MVSTPSELLQVNGLQCSRNERIIFDNLSLTLSRGGFVLIKGSNGSGKTTLMKALAGIHKPTSGEITWDGLPIENNAIWAQTFTYIGHKNALKPELTVLDNLQFYADLQDAELMLPAALHYFQLKGKEDWLLSELSAGWQRRVALARLLLSRSPVWLLDEPTNFLDKDAVALFLSAVETRVNQGGMVIMASHAVESSMASHVLQLEDFAA